MTVQKLIEELQKLPPNAEVVTDDGIEKNVGFVNRVCYPTTYFDRCMIYDLEEQDEDDEKYVTIKWS